MVILWFGTYMVLKRERQGAEGYREGERRVRGERKREENHGSKKERGAEASLCRLAQGCARNAQCGKRQSRDAISG